MAFSALDKLNRATKHIEDLQVATKAFFDSNPYDIVPEHDTDTGQCSYKVARASAVPVEIGLICGDALHNLRSALDHLACRLAERAGNKITADTCFPIAESPEKYESSDTRRKIETMGQEAAEIVRSFNPYKGGNDTLWRIHKLNIADKHRLLVTLGTAHLAHSMTPTERKRIGVLYARRHPNEPTPPTLAGFLIAANPVRILKEGDVVLTVPISELEPYMKFQFDVAFDEPGIIESKPVVNALHEMKQEVSKVVMRLWGMWK